MSSPTDILIQVPSSGEGETITIAVTVVDGQFYFDGLLQTDYKLIEGNTYVFQQSSANGGGHALGISSTQDGAFVSDLIYSYNGNTTTSNIYETYLVTYGAFFTSYEFEVSYTVPTESSDVLYFFSTSSDVTGGSFSVQAPIQSADSFSINENETGVTIGYLQTEDADAEDAHTYSLSGTNADLFEIVDGQLKLKNAVSVSYESSSVLNITITSTDISGESFAKDFVVNVVDQNDSPDAVEITSLRVEDATDGYIIGTLSTTDEDVDDTFSYTLSGSDADQFEVVDGQLKLKDGI
ncbi:hypothetical protein OAJ73_03215, partial [Gammaproteobacteria bacterium]|nr:hypothetical protein [Gammaproteobacteria bacterium]